MKKRTKIHSVLLSLALALCMFLPVQTMAADETVQWINHLDFLPGDSDVAAEYNNVLVRGGGLEITTAAAPLNSFVQQGLQVPAGYLVNGVRVCYVQTGRSHIDQITLLQLQNPPDSVKPLLNDDITFNNSDPGPVCVESLPPTDPIDPSLGALSLRVGVNFANTTESVVILGVGLLTVPDPDSPVAQLEDEVEQLNQNIERIASVLREHGMELETLDRQLDRLTNAFVNHTHTYKTGKGNGHNNVTATSGGPSLLSSDTPQTLPATTTQTVVPQTTPKPQPKAKAKKGRFSR